MTARRRKISGIMELVSQRIETPLGELHVAATEAGICRVSFPVEMVGNWFPWFDRYFSTIPKKAQEPHPLFERFEMQISEYFEGRREAFDIPLDLQGTPFHLRLWRRLIQIPYGMTVTYGELAEEFGLRGGSRAIGRATGSNPVPLLVPCHRVLGSSGGLVGFSGGIAVKERLLELEGARIPFSRDGFQRSF